MAHFKAFDHRRFSRVERRKTVIDSYRIAYLFLDDFDYIYEKTAKFIIYYCYEALVSPERQVTYFSPAFILKNANE